MNGAMDGQIIVPIRPWLALPTSLKREVFESKRVLAAFCFDCQNRGGVASTR